ncbi:MULTISPECIES: hypothetical protein [Actinoplanes]|uniref:hypothetical protein n=1 Tax=Actinoplanes TaxID=1865 RepID=UPI0005F2C71F|nr:MULTISPECIES: hypothetical protein [Actinoplanes]GLY00505.1 hypothetical protein Acsp01_08840 [Actinoplanes sp. NBRC 101535]
MSSHRRHAAPLFKTGTAAVLAAVVAGTGLGMTMMLRTSQAMFSGGTDNQSDSWQTGTVALSDDDAGVALFSSGADGLLTGGQVLTRCIVVKYDGTLTSNTSVKLWSTATGALAPYLNLTVDQGSGSTDRDCTNFTASTAGIYTGTVSGLAAASTNFATGAGSWSPSTNGATMTYRFTVTVQSVAAAQGKSASGTFTWEAQG